jgi:ribosomal protein S18 acetylase RimI-like enzyme
MPPERARRVVFSVRDAHPDDGAAIRAVAGPAWHAAYDDRLGVAAVDRLVDAWYAPGDLRREIAGRDPFVVAEDASGVVGFAQGRRVAGGDGALSRLYVHPDAWGRGVGTALLGATARRLRPAGTLRAVVMAANTVGRAFYDRRGFTLRGRRVTNLEGLSFEVVVLVAPLGPLCALSPDVDRAVVDDSDGERTAD